MKTCPYCGSIVENIHDLFRCRFCEITLSLNEVQENGNRKDLLPDSQPSYADIKRSTRELLELTTIELLYLLKFARSERRAIYSNRKVLVRALKEGYENFKEGLLYTIDEYEFLTRKCFVLENLIRERIGYIPRKITVSYLNNLAERISESKQKKMLISPGERII